MDRPVHFPHPLPFTSNASLLFAASVDSVGANARFAESLGLSYPILSDATKEVAQAYGVLAASGFASRWTFYIGADGRILDIDKRVSAASHGRDIVAKLTEPGFGVHLER